jgi:uncharacterized protein YciW
MDVLDTVTGLSGTPLANLRRQRPEIVRLTEASYRAALAPESEGDLSRVERAALACRMSVLTGDDALADHYRQRLAEIGAGSEETALADPGAKASSPRAAAIARHVDLVTMTPERATRADIEALRSAGLSDVTIVTLAGLIAFVNYQLRVAAGLRMLKGAAR